MAGLFSQSLKLFGIVSMAILFLGTITLIYSESSGVVMKSLRIIFRGEVLGEDQLVAKYWSTGDIILLGVLPTGASCPSINASEYKSKFPAILTAYRFNSIDDIERCATSLPAGVDYVMYDYEPTSAKVIHSPEYIVDQDKTIGFFDRASAVAHSLGKKLIVTPPYVSTNLRPKSPSYGTWDYGEIAKHTDVLLVQTQNIVESPELFKTEVSKIISEVKSKSQTPFFIQFAISKGTAQERLDLLEWTKGTGVDGVLFFHMDLNEADHLNAVDTFFKAVRTKPELSTEEGNPLEKGLVKVSVKETKKLTFLAVTYKHDVPIYSIKIKATAANLRFLKAWHWDRERVDQQTGMLKSIESPLMNGDTLTIIIMLDRKGSGIELSVFDKDNNLITHKSIS